MLKRPKIFSNSNRPIVYSSYNNWVGMEMHTLSEFCFIIDGQKSKNLQKFQIEEVKNLQFINKNDIDFFLDDKKELYETLYYYTRSGFWRNVIQMNLEYREPQFINCDFLC